MRRRKARESALQILYSLDNITAENRHNISAPDTINIFLEHFISDKDIDLDFLGKLLEGTLREYEKFNDLITSQSEHWKLDRMAMVDRNILRFSIYELLFFNDISCSVTINEAVEIGKRFGTDESGAFINGILDQISKRLPENPNKIKY